MAPTTRYALGESGAVAYQVTGSGPDLLFVPPWLSNIEIMWDDPSYARFLECLASFSRLICFDKRGSGLSESVPYTALPTLEQWMDDMVLVMDAVGSRRAAVLGWDFGGTLSMLFAASYPERTSHLVLVDVWAWLPRDEDHPFGIPSHLLEGMVTIVERGWGQASEAPSYLSVMAPAAHADTRFRDWFARFQRLAGTPTFGAAMTRTAFEWDLRPVLPTIRVPTLVMSHQSRRYVRPEHGRHVAEQIAGARHLDLPGGDNLIYREDADTIVAEISAFVTGTRDTPELDRVLATILFTDIAQSTVQLADIGDRRWRELLDAHDALLRARIGEFRGRAVKSTGDGILAIFDGPARAIRCAVAIARDVRALGIEVRAGLHTGEIEARGDDIGGIAVHTAARVMAAAAPGEVLVSRTVKDLVAGSGLRFADRGTHDLKGVPDRWALFCAADTAAAVAGA